MEKVNLTTEELETIIDALDVWGEKDSHKTTKKARREQAVLIKAKVIMIKNKIAANDQITT